MSQDTRKRGLLNDLAGDDLNRMILGVTATEVIDTTSANAGPVTITNCRAISVDSDGIAKFSMIDDAGETTTTEIKTLKAGVMYPYRRITNVFRYYTGTTAVTAKVYNSDGSLVTGLKLHR